MDERYQEFPSVLCVETNTENAHPHLLEGLPVAIQTAGNEDATDDEKLDMYAFALVIYFGRFWAAYFLSAHSLVESYLEVSLEELRGAARYWEIKLRMMGGGNQWMGWAKDIVMEIPDTGFHRNEVARRYLEDLDKHGKTALALAMIDEEKKGDTPTQLRAMTLASPGSHREAVGQLAYILYSMNTSLLKALIQGQLPRLAAVPSGEVNLALQHLNQRREVQPGTYMNSICDDAGLSPTPSQWSTVCELMLTYLEANVEANEMAREIDQNIHPKLNGRPI